MAPSLSRRLSISLMLAVLIVSALAITAINIVLSRTALQNLEHKADETIQYAVGILDVPLWEVNSRYVNEIGQIISQDDAIAKIVIYNDTGAVICSILKENSGDLISRSSKIFHKHKDSTVYVGAVDVSLAKDVYKTRNRQLLYSFILIISLILVSIVVTTGFLMRTYLRKPLDSLNKIVRLYASGTYRIPPNSIPYTEFEPFGTVLADMADKITAQIQKVREAEAKYRTIYENAIEGIFQTTPDGRYISVNPSLSNILGYESPDILIDSVSDIAKEIYVDPARREELLHRLSTQDTVSDFEAQLRRKDGSVLWASFNIRAIRDIDGRMTYLEGFLSDITARKQTEEALKAAQEELDRKEKLAILGRLAGIVGHEIRNPLGVMNNAVYFLKTVMADTNDTVKEYLDIIKQEIDNSQRIIMDLLDFARTKTPQARPLAVPGLITESLGKCKIPETVAVHTDLPDALPEVSVDPFQMKQVFQNLIVNGIQAMPGGGTLRISAKLATGFVEITVSDTGEGISPENMEKLFQPLFTTKTKGIGLGLVVCKNLVEANGGKIEVESRLGEGTSVTVFLPLEKTSERDP